MADRENRAPAGAAHGVSGGLAGDAPVAPAPGRPRSAAPLRPHTLDSESLFAGQRTVEISHQGVLYRLQATRLGKLILTK